MGEQALALCHGRALVVEIVEAGLTDRDALGMLRLGDDLRDCDVQLLVRIMGMRADGKKHARVRFGNLAIDVELFYPGRDGDQRGDAGRGRAAYDSVALGGKVREIEMAMMIDERHGLAHC